MELSDNVLEKLSIGNLRLLAEILNCQDSFNTCKKQNPEKHQLLECMMSYYRLCAKQNHHELNLQNKKNELADMDPSVNPSKFNKQAEIIKLLEVIADANKAKENEEELEEARSKIQQLEKARIDKKVIKYIDKNGGEKTVESFKIIYDDRIPYIEVVFDGQTRDTVLARVFIEEDYESDDSNDKDPPLMIGEPSTHGGTSHANDALGDAYTTRTVSNSLSQLHV